MQALLGKIAVTMTPDITTEYNAGRYVDLEIELADGTVVRERCERPRGSWGAEPISDAEHVVKVRDCLAGSLSPPAIDECIALGNRFEHLDAEGVRRLLSLACAEGGATMLMIDNDVVKRVLTMRECIEAQERAFARHADRRLGVAPAPRHVRAVQSRGRLLPLGLGRRCERRRARGAAQVRHHDLAGRPGRHAHREQILHAARHLLRPRAAVQHAGRRAARHHQRRPPPAHARRRVRRHRRTACWRARTRITLR